MRVRLTAATDIALFIIFDPGALPADVVDSRDPLAAIETLTSSGQAICYSFCSDGSTDFLILVDEDPDQVFLDYYVRIVDNILLRVPTGRLVATGYEDLASKYRPDDFTPKMGDAADIPAGDYVVTAFDVDWRDEVEQEISRRTPPSDQRLEDLVGISLGCAIVFTIVAVLGVFGTWDRLNWKLTGTVLFLYVLNWLIIIPILLFSKRWRRMKELRKDVEFQYPNNVLVLRTLTEPFSDRQFHVGKFGEGFAEDEE